MVLLRWLRLRKWLLAAFVIYLLCHVFLLFQYHPRKYFGNKERELLYQFRNVSSHNSSDVYNDTETSISNSSSTSTDDEVKHFSNVIINSASRQGNVSVLKENHTVTLLEVETTSKHIGLESNPQKTTTSPSWILNAPISNVSVIYECNLSASKNNANIANKRNLHICPCAPNNLANQIFIDTNVIVSYKEIQYKHRDVSVGGHWAPKTCVSRHSIAIIVPYRDREDHLITFLDHMHGFLQKQLLDYTIFVAEQGTPATFNKAKLMNAAYAESKKIKPFDCYVFHDIDMLPEDERNLYTCPSMPRHQGIAVDKYNYTLYWKEIIGGAAVYRPEHFELINGYSNKFWGWGGEDDNMYRRTVAKKFEVLRPPEMLARYHMMTHGKDDGNPRNNKRFDMRYKLIKIQDQDGLNSLKYRTLVIREKSLYTWMLFDLSDY